jgi:hypothetical protein
MVMAIDNNIHTRTSHNIILTKRNSPAKIFFYKNQQSFCENISRE